MALESGIQSRVLLKRLKQALAEEGEGQKRLDRLTHLIANSMDTEVCSVYLLVDNKTLELCATEGLDPASVHKTRLRIGEGLVGLVARDAKPINTDNAPSEVGFRFMPETREERYSSFLGVPIQRLGETLGVLVVQSRISRLFSDDEIYAIEVVAMVLAEMTELGAFVGGDENLKAPHQYSVLIRGGIAHEGAASGNVLLHEPRVVVTNPFAEDTIIEQKRLQDAIQRLKGDVDGMLNTALKGATEEHKKILEAYRMFANSKSWLKRMEEDIESGLSAEAAVEKEQSTVRARMSRVADAYLRDRLHDLDDLSNRLLRILTGQGNSDHTDFPESPILVARNIGPGELLEYGRNLKGIVLEEGSVGGHATIIARAMAIPLIINASAITTEALNGDHVLVDGDQGIVHLRPDDNVKNAFSEKIAMQSKKLERYQKLKDVPAVSKDGITINLMMNAGLMGDLPSLENSGAEGVGLFRTELQFLARNSIPKRGELAALYSRVLDAAGQKKVIFRTLDVGSDKVLPYMRPTDEPNPALGWRAIRLGLDKPGIMKMQLQAFFRAANLRNISIMFPMIAQFGEFIQARELLKTVLENERKMGHSIPKNVEIGAMLETPSLVFAPKQFFELADFISIGGNDLKQFFYAADRENERVRKRYDTLNVSFLNLIKQIVIRCEETSTPLSFCGEDAGKPLEAVCLLAMGIRTLSMRPASIGAVKALIRDINIIELRRVIDQALVSGEQSIRPKVESWIKAQI
ncbi:MAG: phosphoenolpyruvate--protein phosphotransferase [Rhodobacteraceae bacterium]|nr:phosphoenolpyruvate--protein phosphotransferase [Paracoccaceae bacterium]MBV03411.1 phosphoenolpyruvate--protein phosphotransferase [Paracoccaceae bacterium]MDG1939892.1 phosphoenolpyruvate--protein phosphotransferase [Paracoccaceae bacterium]|tara:strand:- start:68 stop:2314 length:2247 start_codon:yes stop_codon:yes gene_type:complete